MRLRHCLLPLLLLLITALPAKAATKRQAAPAPKPAGPAAGPAVRPHFSSTRGLMATCTAMARKTPAGLKESGEQLAWVLCDAVQLTQHLLTWRRQREGMAASDPRSFQESIQAVRRELTEALSRIQTSRRILEGVKITKPSLVLAPGKWALDLDGDGMIAPSEAQFFWVPSATAPDHYIAPVVKLDQSDVLWAVAYCHFSEGLLHLVLSYDVKMGPTTGMLEVSLRDRERIGTQALPSLIAGVKASKALRASLLAETDDDLEWIPNPRQKQTSFPLRMDEQTFDTWGKILDQLDDLFAGRTLLGGAPSSHGLLLTDALFTLCPKEEGLNLRDLFLAPVAVPTSRSEWQQRCVKSSKQLPLSPLHRTFREVLERHHDHEGDTAGEWMLPRYLYWVN